MTVDVRVRDPRFHRGQLPVPQQRGTNVWITPIRILAPPEVHAIDGVVLEGLVHQERI